jgi:hypothetical protein
MPAGVEIQPFFGQHLQLTFAGNDLPGGQQQLPMAIEDRMFKRLPQGHIGYGHWLQIARIHRHRVWILEWQASGSTGRRINTPVAAG